MPPSPSTTPTSTRSNPENSDYQAIYEVQDDLDDFHLSPPSAIENERPAKFTSHIGAKRIGKWKIKARPRLSEGNLGECYLLGLPEDVLQVLLARIPPRSLHALSATCSVLREQLKSETIWRQSYINRFLSYGSALESSARRDVRLLAQGCMGSGKGWRREALAREAMLQRWIGSKTATVVHHPPVGFIDAISLSYPPFLPPAPKKLVVGKTHQTPSKPGVAGDETAPTEAESSHTPTKMTHRQKYEALLATTTRPPPYVLSAGLGAGGVVRSDPISGKASKGYWGPSRHANLHVRPQTDWETLPTAVHLPPRKQTHTLWGLSSGFCVHTTMGTKPNSAHGGRALSVNVTCESTDVHEGPVSDIWQPELASHRWITAGQDGLVKYWQLNPAQNVKTGKQTPQDTIPANITCLFTSSAIPIPFENRSDAVKRRQHGHPDAVIFARCNVEHDVVCGVTRDGDLRVWFDASSSAREVRLDAGSEETHGGVRQLELDVTVGNTGVMASVLVHHTRSWTCHRYDINIGKEVPTVSLRTFANPHGAALTTILACLASSPPIAQPEVADPVLSATPSSPPLETEGSISTNSSPSTPRLLPDIPTPVESTVKNEFGRFVIAGDVQGAVWIWPWDGESSIADEVRPIRGWEGARGRVTALDMNCGLVAVGSYDGYIKVFDPLPSSPDMLRSFHAQHVSPADQIIANSNNPDAKKYTVNQIILENDLIIASIGNKVFTWRAGSGKGRQNGKAGDNRRISAGKGDLKGNNRTLDMKSLNQDATLSHQEIQAHNANTRVQSHTERQQLAAMEDLGLEDGDDALQYALMLSVEDGDPEEDEAVKAVADFQRSEDDDLQRVLEMIRRSEDGEE